MDSSGESLFTERFAAVARRFPETVAIESGATRLTYGELYSRASRLGSHLRALGAGPESVVGLLLEKSPEYVVALLGAWFAGGAFLPLDPHLPPERLSFLLRDSGARWLITSEEEAGGRTDLEAPIVTLAAAAGAVEGPPVPLRPETLAYVIYTSGSTGAPKGVMVPHGGLVGVLDAQVSAFRIGLGSRSLWYLSTSFDASVSDLGVALLSGATLVIEPRSALETAAGLLTVLREQGITHLDLPPALLRVLDLAGRPECLQTIIIGGESCPPDVVRRWARPDDEGRGCRVVNVYGPTEATICTSLCICDPDTWTRPLIGDPLPGVTYHLLDTERQPVGAGTPAELYIGGTTLARGYLNRPELDAARFVVVEGQRLYRTGDRVVRHRDGGIEFLGRLDRQVKVRGQLVAPEEIEARLLAHPEVERAAVVRKATGGEREALVAFVVPRGGTVPVSGDLRAYLARSLPHWMLPQRFEILAGLPLTPTGKIDLAALASQPLANAEAGPAHVAPSTPMERLLAEVWRNVLRVRTIGVTDDFFELGGDSLAVVEVVAAVEARGAPLPPSLMLSHPTIAALAARMERLQDQGSTDALSCDALRARVAWDKEWEQRLKAARVRRAAHPPAGAPRRILLTGATGFLGSRLLCELLSRTRAEIVCPVRAESATEARHRCLGAVRHLPFALPAEQEHRIVALAGDVASPHLGLSETEWSRLTLGVDTVYHCAAQVNALLPYAALEPVNVGGTREALRLLSEGRPKRLHYASTLSVFVASDRNRGRMEERDHLERTEVVYGGYAQTKWAAEHLLRASEGAAGPIAFYRLGLLTGDPVTGRAAPADFLSMFFRGVAELGCVPERAGAALRVDVTPVDYAARAMAHLSLSAEDGLSTFHIASPR
ncbi:MAG TPA: non-ribosomal peptide synthetase, partial [Armatimonadota bacterium]|nr:non-ribosomal peptide synthetase [Armatimonadota bacterium]